HPDDNAARSSLAIVINNIGLMQCEDGRTAEALASFRSNLEIHQALATSDPTSPSFRRMESYANRNIGTTLGRLGRRDASLESLRAALAIHESLALAYPGEVEYQDDLAAVHGELALARIATGEHDQARADLRAAERAIELVPSAK